MFARITLEIPGQDSTLPGTDPFAWQGMSPPPPGSGITNTTEEAPLHLDIDADYGLVWLTWVQPEEDGSLSLAFAVYDGTSFPGIRTVPLRSTDDKDLEKARDRVRRER